MFFNILGSNVDGFIYSLPSHSLSLNTINQFSRSNFLIILMPLHHYSHPKLSSAALQPGILPDGCCWAQYLNSTLQQRQQRILLLAANSVSSPIIIRARFRSRAHANSLLGKDLSRFMEC